MLIMTLPVAEIALEKVFSIGAIPILSVSVLCLLILLIPDRYILTRTAGGGRGNISVNGNTRLVHTV